MDKLKPVQFPFTCRCGVRHAKLATARWDKVERLHYDCATCRPRPDPRDHDSTRQSIFQGHNCVNCDNGRLPCKQGNPLNCDNPRARND